MSCDKSKMSVRRLLPAANSQLVNNVELTTPRDMKRRNPTLRIHVVFVVIRKYAPTPRLCQIPCLPEGGGDENQPSNDKGSQLAFL